MRNLQRRLFILRIGMLLQQVVETQAPVPFLVGIEVITVLATDLQIALQNMHGNNKLFKIDRAGGNLSLPVLFSKELPLCFIV